MKFREPIKDNFRTVLAVVMLTVYLGIVSVSEIAQGHFLRGLLALGLCVTIAVLIIRYLARPPLR